MEEEDTYYYMTHATYLTYEYQLRDPDFWHESIKNKYNQQQPTIVKEEELRVESVVLDREDLDVYVCLVDCLKHDSATTTSVANGATGCATDDILVCKDFK